MCNAVGKDANFRVTMGNVLMLTAPLTITTEEETDEAFGIVEVCFKETA